MEVFISGILRLREGIKKSYKKVQKRKGTEKFSPHYSYGLGTFSTLFVYVVVSLFHRSQISGCKILFTCLCLLSLTMFCMFQLLSK